MLVMLLGLALFLGAHAVRIYADDWRSARIAAMGEPLWKVGYALVSVVGLALAIWGYGLTRLDPVFIWFPPVWTYHLTALLMLPAFVLLAAAYVPGNHIRARLGHPMVLAVKIWAFAHLIANGRLGDVVFFGAFLIWAVLLFRASRRRTAPIADAAPGTASTLVTVIVGILAYLAFALYLHPVVTGVPVMG